MMHYKDPSKRHDFVLLFDVVNGNPNGDPDAGNMPRIDPETNNGFVTDVALKRKVRDYAVMAHGMDIFIQSKSALNTLYFNAASEAGLKFPEVEITDEELMEWLLRNAPDIIEVDEENKKVKYIHEFKKASDIIDKLEEENIEIPPETKEKLDVISKALVEAKKGLKKVSQRERDSVREYMIKKYYDIRMFGAVLTAGTNAGQVRGPVQLTFAKSVSPILPMDISITRIAVTREADRSKKQTEMGRKPIIPYGLYRAHGFYNPKLAERLTSAGNPVSTKDLEVLWEALQNMFDFDRSASRGEMACRGLYIFTHKDENGLGNMSAHKLFDMVKVKQKDITVPPRSFSDYSVSINKEELLESIDLQEFE